MTQTTIPAFPRFQIPCPQELCRAIHVYRATSAPTAVPMALESVHAGFPSVAQDYFSGDFSFDEHIIEHPGTTFIVTVAGDSMQGAGIWDGDLLVVDRALTPQSGDVIIAVLNGELTVKRLLLQGSRPVLHAENPRYPDFRPSNDEELTVWGVVTGNFHSQRRAYRKPTTQRYDVMHSAPGIQTGQRTSGTQRTDATVPTRSHEIPPQDAPISFPSSSTSRSTSLSPMSSPAPAKPKPASIIHTHDHYPHDGWTS